MAKRNSKSRTTPSCTRGCAPTQERQQRLGGVRSEPIYEKSDSKTFTNRYRAVGECTLDHYLDAKKINLREHGAGMIFGRAYQRFVLRIKVDDFSGSHGDLEMGFLMPLHSEKLLRQAYEVLSEAQKTLVINVCGHGYGVGDTNRLKTFKRGLGVLVRLWKLN